MKQTFDSQASFQKIEELIDLKRFKFFHHSEVGERGHQKEDGLIVLIKQGHRCHLTCTTQLKFRKNTEGKVYL
jgi:hypothetical protein